MLASNAPNRWAGELEEHALGIRKPTALGYVLSITIMCQLITITWKNGSRMERTSKFDAIVSDDIWLSGMEEMSNADEMRS
jgi:hypothetical protein